MSIKLVKAEVEDTYVRENFKILEAYLNSKFMLNFDFKLFQNTFKENGANQKIPHNLGFQPSDVIVTSQKGTGTLTWLYDKFDKTDLYFTVTGTSDADPIVVRAMVGIYREK